MYLEIMKKAGYSVLALFDVNPVILPCVIIGIIALEFLFEILVLKKRYWKLYLYKSL